MKKVDLKRLVTDLEGKPVKGNPQDAEFLTIGRSLALIFAVYKGTRYDALKAWEFSKSFYKKDEILLDKSDVQGVEDAVKQDQNFGVMVKGQILETLNDAVDEDDKKK